MADLTAGAAGVTSVRRNAAMTVGAFGPEAAAETASPLTKTLDDIHAQVRQAAATALVKLGPSASGALPKLRKMAGKRREAARIQAAAALWSISEEPEPSLSILLDELQRSDRPWEAAEAFQQLGAIAAPSLPKLVELVRSGEGETLYFAATALANMGKHAESSVPELRSLADGGDERRELIKAVLEQIEAK